MVRSNIDSRLSDLETKHENRLITVAVIRRSMFAQTRLYYGIKRLGQPVADGTSAANNNRHDNVHAKLVYSPYLTRRTNLTTQTQTQRNSIPIENRAKLIVVSETQPAPIVVARRYRPRRDHRRLNRWQPTTKILLVSESQFSRRKLMIGLAALWTCVPRHVSTRFMRAQRLPCGARRRFTAASRSPRPTRDGDTIFRTR